MANVGTIGTSQITRTFLQACIASRAFKITHVYSRTKTKAQQLIDDLFIPQATADDDLDNFLSAADLDIVYVASLANSCSWFHTLKIYNFNTICIFTNKNHTLAFHTTNFCWF